MKKNRFEIKCNKITKYKDNLGIEQKAEPNKNYLIYLSKKGFTFVQEYKDDVDVVSLITDLIDDSKDTIQSIKRIIEHQCDITQIVRYDYKNYYGVDIKRI